MIIVFRIHFYNPLLVPVLRHRTLSILKRHISLIPTLSNAELATFLLNHLYGKASRRHFYVLYSYLKRKLQDIMAEVEALPMKYVNPGCTYGCSNCQLYYLSFIAARTEEHPSIQTTNLLKGGLMGKNISLNSRGFNYLDTAEHAGASFVPLHVTLGQCEALIRSVIQSRAGLTHSSNSRNK